MSIPLKRQGPVADNLYDLLVTAAPLDLDSSAVASLADKAYVAIRDRLIMLDIRAQLEPLAARRAAERAVRTAHAELEDLASRIQYLDVAQIDRTELMR